MGKGKGDIEVYVLKVKKGQILYEIDNKKNINIKEIFKIASKQLPIKTRIVLKIGL